MNSRQKERCLVCHTPTRSDALFCRRCGADVKDSAPVPKTVKFSLIAAALGALALPTAALLPLPWAVAVLGLGAATMIAGTTMATLTSRMEREKPRLPTRREQLVNAVFALRHAHLPPRQPKTPGMRVG